MGIPSFYRHLCRKFPKLITQGSGPRPEWLCLDFNCAMYYVLRQMPPVSSSSSVATWEKDFCKGIVSYMEELIVTAQPTTGVYVSCDGVVCAAKRKQQRLRRFKGPWASAQEAAVRAAAGGAAICEERQSGWDQNALTPGSAFMALLGDELTTGAARLGKRTGLAIEVSTTAEGGEGEHKLLRRMREVRPASCTIYGLDADLILLSMLLGSETGAAVRLLREAQEFEGGAGGWRTLDICSLADVLVSADARRVRDYVACMSLLGNDFLPRSLTITVRDDGIPRLLATLQTVWAQGLRVVTDSGAISRAGLLALLEAWASTQEEDMRLAVQNAARTAGRHAGIGDSPADTAMREWNAQPARWNSIGLMMGVNGTLRKDWQNIYRSVWRAGTADDYLKGVAWTWDYYTGRPVDQGWYFREHLPPLWTDMVAALKVSEGEVIAGPPVVNVNPIPDWLHLLSVLPRDSVRRLLPPERQKFMDRSPWYWPSSWSLFDIGRSQMWECEPVIPVIPERILRGWAL
jgi:5'-3' exonuclease